MVGEVPWPTVQLNRNAELGYHLDSNDVMGQWSMLTVLQHGKYEGGLYMVPEYGLSVDPAEGGLLLSRLEVGERGST